MVGRFAPSHRQQIPVKKRTWRRPIYRALTAFLRYFIAMQPHRKLANIALIGFMGTGKTSVGRILAEQLGFEFLDTDELIQSRTERSITEIFAQDGEPAFRAMERAVVSELGNRE